MKEREEVDDVNKKKIYVRKVETKIRAERKVTREERQRGKKLRDAKSCVKDTVTCPFF